jgi:hypothetical protein
MAQDPWIAHFQKVIEPLRGYRDISGKNEAHAYLPRTSWQRIQSVGTSTGICDLGLSSYTLYSIGLRQDSLIAGFCHA